MKRSEFFLCAVRSAVTGLLLVQVYWGSRVALVILLALMCLGLELTGALLRWQHREL